MLPIQHYVYIYEVRVYYGEDEVASENTTNVTTLSFKHLSNHTNMTFTISITVIDIHGQRSNATVSRKTILYIESNPSMIPS